MSPLTPATIGEYSGVPCFSNSGGDERRVDKRGGVIWFERVETKQLARVLLARDPLPPLLPRSPWRSDWRGEIDESGLPEEARAVLHLWNDDLEAAHELAQTDGSTLLRLCHAVLHRREGDFSNSLYWYARAADHPLLRSLRERLPEWSPEWFVGLVSRVGEGEAPEVDRLRRIQAEELRLAWRYASGELAE